MTIADVTPASNGATTSSPDFNSVVSGFATGSLRFIQAAGVGSWLERLFNDCARVSS